MVPGALGVMDCFQTVIHHKGYLCCQLLLFFIWLSSFQDVVAVQTVFNGSHVSSMAELGLANPPTTGFFDPIEISPAVIPHYPNPADEPLAPMYPTFPTRYEPVLTGKCPVNFSTISSLMEKTASDCSQPLAALVGNVICCPQFSSLIRIFRGLDSFKPDNLVLQNSVANDCFTDIISILASRGANSTIATLCSINSSNLTGGSCPVKDISAFDKTANTSGLLEACTTVDPLKEKLSSDAANTAFRILSACKVNKVCPLDFNQPSEVVKACRNVAAPSPSCCSSLNTYISGIQKQMLITNKQAIICATVFGSMLRKGGVMENVYELCDVDLKDFSIQAYGQQGCLLKSLPSDVIFDNITGISFICDLSDNIAAPWPSSSSISSVSLCAPEMSLPALPTAETFKNLGSRGGELEFMLPVFSLFILCTLLY
ncbi:putative GPI-anchored protein [Prunus yedoensis var. nudiflora]|uniref:Putative GPI-anchored protein n=1 Tax=Prunus yedoensis var. nudiflora TaxID=2094558 RepID=A0A314XQW5_PRUYE|nr:putative GPI-anchored protein [Prunus yedoensis var. nudiflora]